MLARLAFLRLAFLLHAAVETPAAATFLFAPQRQLSPALLASSTGGDAEVVLLLQNYGGLLASSVLLSLVMAVRGCTSPLSSFSSPSIQSHLRGLIALALGSYHLFPSRRAYLRKTRSIGLQGPQSKTLGGPTVHLAVHIVCFVALTSAGLMELSKEE
jgi:hypothetical protein